MGSRSRKAKKRSIVKPRVVVFGKRDCNTDCSWNSDCYVCKCPARTIGIGASRGRHDSVWW